MFFGAAHSVNNFSNRTLPDLGLTEVEEVADLLHVLSHNQVSVLRIALLLLGLLCQDVAVIGVMTLYLATTGEHESLLCSGICLYFWHFLFCLISYY